MRDTKQTKQDLYREFFVKLWQRVIKDAQLKAFLINHVQCFGWSKASAMQLVLHLTNPAKYNIKEIDVDISDYIDQAKMYVTDALNDVVDNNIQSFEDVTNFVLYSHQTKSSPQSSTLSNIVQIGNRKNKGKVKQDDTPDTLAARVFEQECLAYPQAIRLFAEDRLLVKDGKVIIKD